MKITFETVMRNIQEKLKELPEYSQRRDQIELFYKEMVALDNAFDLSNVSKLGNLTIISATDRKVWLEKLKKIGPYYTSVNDTSYCTYGVAFNLDDACKESNILWVYPISEL